MGQVPQIEIGKAPEEHANVRTMLLLPAYTPFGNLALKHLRIVERLDHVNRSIRDVFESYHRAMADQIANPLTHHQLIAEEVVYWLRKTADELIALRWILAERNSRGSYPQRIGQGSIGALLGSTSIPQTLAGHVKFLETLNEVSNAYKHSFVNSDISFVGRDEPVVFALALRWNDLANQTNFYSVPLRDVVQGFSEFFRAVQEELRACSLPHLGNELGSPPRTPVPAESAAR